MHIFHYVCIRRDDMTAGGKGDTSLITRLLVCMTISRTGLAEVVNEGRGGGARNRPRLQSN